MKTISARVAAIAAVLPAISATAALAAAAPHVPDFSGVWQHGVPGVVFEVPPDVKFGPVIDVTTVDCQPSCPPRAAGVPFIGVPDNPILKPWARASVRDIGDRWKRGEIINSATERCMPNGVPNILSILGPVQILQTPKEVTIIYGRDAQARHIYLNQAHAKNPKPSWYGESVGHYEGDTLVVDTIGLNDKSLIDRFGTPQTESTHVVERYRLIDGGRTLYVSFSVSDQTAFNHEWSGAMRYARNGRLAHPVEEVCAENNRGIDIPTDDTPDF